jgi:FtsP/CotA-like multicopper oxidase with cupredoxin domain
MALHESTVIIETGKRYRLVMTNHSGDNHPVHLHRHTFEITRGRRQDDCWRDEGHGQADEQP